MSVTAADVEAARIRMLEDALLAVDEELSDKRLQHVAEDNRRKVFWTAVTPGTRFKVSAAAADIRRRRPRE